MDTLQTVLDLLWDHPEICTALDVHHALGIAEAFVSSALESLCQMEIAISSTSTSTGEKCYMVPSPYYGSLPDGSPDRIRRGVKPTLDSAGI